MKNVKTLPSAQYLNELFFYNPEEGNLIWRERPASHFKNENACKRWNGRMAGTIAGSRDSDGYIVIRIDGISYKRSRLVVKLIAGADPDCEEVDHINRIRIDDRYENLRPATASQNRMNTKKRSDNSTGYRGVFRTVTGSFIAAIHIDGVRKHLGTFPTARAAYEAYRQASIELHGEFAAA